MVFGLADYSCSCCQKTFGRRANDSKEKAELCCTKKCEGCGEPMSIGVYENKEEYSRRNYHYQCNKTRINLMKELGLLGKKDG